MTYVTRGRPLLGGRARCRRRPPAVPRPVIVLVRGMDTLLLQGELAGRGAALWRTGARESRGCAGGHPLEKRLPVLPISRTSPGEMEEDPPAFQRVSMDGSWLLVQRRRLAATL